MSLQFRRAATATLALTLMLLAALLGGPVTAASAETLASPRKVTAWLPYWDQARGLQSFLANADMYASVSPFWYEMTAGGGISRYPGAEDAGVLSGLRGTGVPVVPTITNNFDPARVSTMLASSTSRAAHVTVLVDLVSALGYDGIDVDYEGLVAADRDRYSAFAGELATALHARGKTLSLAVHAKTAEPGTWSGPQAQDYAALGAVADRVRIMAYDYSWETSPAGPIAPLSWVDAVAAFASSQIPAAKVELGMSLYGYDWVGSRGEGVTHDVALGRLASFGATRTWDSAAAEPTFTYSSGGSAHTVYYADAQSVAARLAVVDTYGLAGAAFWRLGGEDPAVWSTVRNRWYAGTAPAPPPAPVADTVAPSVPAALTAAPGIRRVNLTWNASTDTGGSGLAGYEVLRAISAAGPWTVVATTTVQTLSDRSLLRGRTYWYAVQAYDNAGNRSAASAVVSATAR